MNTNNGSVAKQRHEGEFLWVADAETACFKIYEPYKSSFM
jgi:hypothetical protein